MAVTSLLSELAKPEYEGLDTKAKVAALNEWKTEYIPCRIDALKSLIENLLIPAKVQTARDKQLVDDDLWNQWYSLTITLEKNNPDAILMFDVGPLFLDQMFASLATVGAIAEHESYWLRDLGRRQWTIGRQVYHDDVTEDIVTKSEALKPVVDKVAQRKADLEETHRLAMLEMQATHDALQVKGQDGAPAADPAAFELPWEKP